MSSTNTFDCADSPEIRNTFQQIENKAIKIGYSDGINDGRESVFQHGFDQGYRNGLKAAFNFEKFTFFFNYLNVNKINNEDLAKEKEIFATFPMKGLTSLQLKHNSLNSVSQEYIDEALNKFAHKMPVTANLLSVQADKDFM